MAEYKKLMVELDASGWYCAGKYNNGVEGMIGLSEKPLASKPREAKKTRQGIKFDRM